jgi:hypothetical protein
VHLGKAAVNAKAVAVLAISPDSKGQNSIPTSK